MKLSFNWLNEYIDLNEISISDLVHIITMSICEVEEVYKKFEIHPRIVIGKVLECKKIESSELSLCKVFDGEESYEVICGANNVRENIYVIVAKIGSKLKINDQEVEIQPKVIRGISSYGMICSARELGIESIIGDNSGIIVIEELSDRVFQYAYEKDQRKIHLNNGIKPGLLARNLFPYEDIILSIDNKSITHRPDLWGHFGFAIELAGVLNKKMKFNLFEELKKLEKRYNHFVDFSIPEKNIEILNQSALSYNGVVCKNVKIEESPIKIKAYLSAIDQKTINNIVDISNFIMYELGQPNHAFDFDELKEKKILIDLSKEEIKFTALDGNEYNIPAESIFIYDGNSPVALGGIIGGLDSGIKETTNSIFIESATFPRSNIRKTISATGIRTESARRFEKGMDPYKSRLAIYRFLKLLKEQNKSIKWGKIISQFTVPEKKENLIETSVDFIRMKLGFSISIEEIKDILNRLNFKVKFSKNKLAIKVPSYRSYYDITIPEDIVEEIGRVYGYDNIKPVSPQIFLSKPVLPYKGYFERQLKYFFCSIENFYETSSYSFSSLEENLWFGYEGIKLKNPAQKQKERMRVSLLPGIFEQTKNNIFRVEESGLFELGKIFIPQKNSLPLEKEILNFIYFSNRPERFKYLIYSFEDIRLGLFLYIRKKMENLFKYFHFNIEIKIPERKYFYYHPNCQVEFYEDQILLGHMGLLHPEIYKKYDFPEDRIIVCGELYFEEMFSIINQKRILKETHYKPPSVYPKSNFDFTILMNKDQSTYEPVKLIRNLYTEIIKIEIVDIYSGPSIKENQKSVSYRVHCLDYKPITNQRLQEMLDHIIKKLEQYGYPLRT